MTSPYINLHITDRSFLAIIDAAQPRGKEPLDVQIDYLQPEACGIVVGKKRSLIPFIRRLYDDCTSLEAITTKINELAVQ